MSIPGVGDVVAMPLPGGGFGACQVVGIDKDVVTVYALAWYSEGQPELRQLADVPPLILDHHANRGEAAKISISDGEPPPPDWVPLGRLPTPAGMSGSSNSYSGWSWLRRQIVAQRRWEQQLPAAVKQAYRAAATRGEVDVDFGGGPVVLGAALGRLDLTGTDPAADPVTLPAARPVNWSALDQLPRCTSLTWAGPDRGLTAALTDRPIIGDLTWTAAPSQLDLRGTGLTSLSINGTIDLLQLPDGLTALHLLDGASVAQITAAMNGEWLRLSINSSEQAAKLPAGFGRLQDLRYNGQGTISAAPLSVLQNLRSLWLSWNAAPGDLHDAAALAELPGLTRLTLTDAYGIDAHTLPDLPALTGLTIHGLRRTTATVLKARYRHSPVHLRISGAKNDTWLAANLTNPFRDWTDDDPRGGAAACKAYAAAVRAIDALPTNQPTEASKRVAATEPVLRRFVDQLNRIEQRHDLIDTLRRDEAGDAFLDLAARAHVPTDVAEQWFDDWRDF
jgi:hypothetical protein